MLGKVPKGPLYTHHYCCLTLLMSFLIISICNPLYFICTLLLNLFLSLRSCFYGLSALPSCKSFFPFYLPAFLSYFLPSLFFFLLFYSSFKIFSFLLYFLFFFLSFFLSFLLIFFLSFFLIFFC